MCRYSALQWRPTATALCKYSAFKGTTIVTVVCKPGASNTRAAYGPRRRFVRPEMLSGNFQITNIDVAKCLEKRRLEIIESNPNDTQCGFCPGRGTTDHISLSRKILRNLGSMLKTSSHALSTSRKKAYNRVPCEKL